MMDVAPTAREIIFASEHLKVVYRPGTGDTVIVMFSSFGFRAVGDDFWGAGLADSVDMPALGFVAMRPNWFPVGDMQAALPVALGRIADRRVVTYGHSQGAYGALKFGKALNASCALAFSPQWSINPANVKSFDSRYHSYYDPELRNGDPIEQDDLCPRNFIVVDRAETSDLAHAGILMAMRGIKVVPAPFAGHGTVVLIAEGRQGRPLMRLCRQAEGIEARDLRQLIRTARRTSESYRQTKIEQLQKLLPEHRPFYDDVFKSMPEGREKIIAYVLECLGTMQLEDAARSLADLSDDALVSTNLLRLWPIFRQAGFDAGELRIAPLFKRAHPDSAFARLHAVGSMIKFGQSEEALRELDALGTVEDAENCTRFFLEHYGRLERLDLASAFLDHLFDTSRLKASQRFSEGLKIVATLRAKKRFVEASRELLALSRLCKGDTAATLTLIGAALETGAFGLANDMLKSFAGMADPPPLSFVYQAQFQSQTDPPAARQFLERLTRMQCQDPGFWQKLSELGERMAMPKVALAGAQKAFDISGEDFHARKRLAQVLVANGNTGSALRHLRILASKAESAGPIAERFVDMAVACGDHALALRFGEQWLAETPENIEANILICRVLTDRRDLRSADAAMRKLLGLIERGLRLERAHFNKALDIARRLGSGRERDVAALALIAYPADPDFAPFAHHAGLFGGRAEPSHTQPAPTARKGILARFGIARHV